MPVPTLLLVGGVVLGVLLALVCRVAGLGSPRGRRARAADQRLRAAIAEVAEELVVAPVEAELDGVPDACATGWSRRSR